MKKLLVLLLSLFFLSSPSVFADDISDFEIEGISIGDSLLDYMTEDEITGVTSKMFPNAIKTEKVFNSSIDSSGESIVDGIYLKFESRDDIELSCDNFKESIRIERGMGEGLNVSIRTNEIITWLRN